MVNYCCVHGCGRNSRTSKQLYFYSVPKDVARQEEWLKAARREDLLEKPQDKRYRYRFCSRHFSPQNIKNKHLCADAVPTLHLPGCEVEEASDDEAVHPIHSNIACNNCRAKIVGFRYKCVTCADFDLCSRCEMAEAHEQHMMLRIPSPVKFKNIENMVKKWQHYYNEENSDSVHDDTSDDEPIQKYASNQDTFDISEDVKTKIRAEVERVLKIKSSSNKKPVKPQRVLEGSKKPVNFIDMTSFGNTPDIAFADVNETHSGGGSLNLLNVKSEISPCLFPNTEVPQRDLGIKLLGEISDINMMMTSDEAPKKYYFHP